MPTEKLTARRVETVRAPDGTRLDIRDSEAKGLVLRVQRRGPKIWRFEYKGRRLNSAGNAVELSVDPEKRKKQIGDDGKTIWETRIVILGEAASVTLDGARSEAQMLRHQLSRGIDPALEAKREAALKIEQNKRRQASITLRQMLERRLGHPAKPEKRAADGSLSTDAVPEAAPQDTSLAPNTIREYRMMLCRDVYNAPLADVPAHEVSADAVSDILDGIEDRNKDGRGKRSADLLRNVLSSSYRWAIKSRLQKTNPLRDLPKRATKGARKRVPSKSEVIAIWSALGSDELTMSWQMRCILRIIILTGQRRGEAVSIRRSDVHLEGTAATHEGHEVDAPVWIIPGDTVVKGKVVFGVTKNGIEQVVPLSKQATEIFRQVLATHSSDYLFPPMHTVRKGKISQRPHVNEESVTAAMVRLRKTFDISDVTVHDMRRAITTTIGDAGFRPDILDRVLNHKRTGVTAEHYDFSRMLPDVRAALQTWADLVLPQSGPKAAAYDINLCHD
jgi:integrase